MGKTLFVCTEWQRELLELVATWCEQEERYGDDPEAALIYLFFQEGTLFDPPDCPCPVTLTTKQASQLEEQLELFLYRAEEMGFGLDVKNAISRIKDRKKESVWKQVPRYGEYGFVIFLVSWAFCSISKAFIAGLLGPLVFLMIEDRILATVDLLDKRGFSRFSKLLRRMNAEKIEELLKGAEERLIRIGWLNRRRWS